MKFLLLTLITHTDPAKSAAQRLREVVETAVLAEEVGFDGFAVGERHERPFTVWHGSATSRESVDLAAEFGDPLFSANVTNPIEPYAELVEYYRERWVFHGHDPADVHVGAGSAGFYVARNSQDAIETYRPIFEARLATFRRLGVEPVFPTLEDAIERSSILVGSPQQLIEKIHRYHERLGHEVMHLHADADGLTDKQHRAALELFQSEVAPAVRPLEGR